MKELPQISNAEYEVMKVVWAHTPVSTNEVVGALSDVSGWSPKTIQTLLSRLVKKGALSYYKEGRVFIYTPLIFEDEYRDAQSHSFLSRFYGGALDHMVAHFIDKDMLSEADIEELKHILECKTQKDKE